MELRDIRRRSACLLALVRVFAVGVPALSAQSVSTDPVGAIVIPLTGNSDTLVSLPFQRPAVLETAVQSISGNAITISASANVADGQFAYNGTTQPNTYYVQFLTGNRDGMYYTIISNTATTITVDNNGDTGLAGNVTSSDTFQVIPYWTLNTLFPNGQGLYTSDSLTPNSTVMLPQNGVAGINLSPGSAYYYYTGSAFGGAGWKKTGDLLNKYPNVVLPPDSSFVVRNPSASPDTSLTLVGAVPMSAQAIIVNNLQANTAQDNVVALPVPVNVTLAQSGLYPNVISGSPGLTPQDVVMVYDPSTVAINKSASASYYYYTGTLFNGPGWKKAGDLNGIYNNTQIFIPGQGYVIRRIARPTAVTNIWYYLPPYLSP